MTLHSKQSTLQAIAGLAEEIAQASPESADKAVRILDLVRRFDAEPDQAIIEDAIEAETEGDLSDSRVRSASSAVMRSISGDDEGS